MIDKEPAPKSLMSTLSTMLGVDPIPALKQNTKLHDGFMLPIEYLDKSDLHILSPVVCSDLELVETETTKSMYTHLCPNTDTFGNIVISDLAKCYTTNVEFIEDTQTVVENMTQYDKTELNSAVDTEEFSQIWRDLKEDATFLEKYSFMEWNMVEYLNRSTPFLQIYSIINIASPLSSLLLPLFFLIFPFAILKMRGVPISFSQYINTLKDIAKSHFIGKVLNMQSFSFDSILYLLLMGGLYVLQTYQNVNYCIRYYANMKRINTHLCQLRTYLQKTTAKMERFSELNRCVPYYTSFCKDVDSHRETLHIICDQLSAISPFQLSFSKFTQVGYMLQMYYTLYSSIEYEESLRYSVGFNGYMNVLSSISREYRAGYLGKASFIDDLIEDLDANSGSDSDSVVATEFKQQYYPPHKMNKDVVKNTCSLNKNMIITGINASGKTTTLKTAAMNVIFSQQFGFGFYKSATIKPYHHIHSYLNIPDTSGRDSLFQAESRRCKEILDKIKHTPNDRHFCIFDELYSGTNPKEAAQSATSLLHYLSKNEKVHFILTTHYIDVCKKMKRNERVQNYMMDVKKSSTGGFVYTYKLKTGISKQKGGIEILKQMDYPTQIIEYISTQQ
jgi:hypothetical protein